MTGSPRPPAAKRRKRAAMSEEDRALWDHVARSVSPPRRAKPRIPHTPSQDDEELLAHFEQRLRNETARAKPPGSDAAGPAKPLRPAPSVHPTKQKSPPLSDFDRKAVRRIRSGRIEIEARLDLHGLRQDEAHSALRVFLAASHSRGLRWVLVITGKGRPETTSATDRPVHIAGERGILRRNVPRWLADPDLRPLVVSYTTAALHHGGEGALYIQLRARRSEHHR